MKKQKHLSFEERNIIEGLVQAGKSNKGIAEVLGRATSTIGRELERNCWRFGSREYRSETADGIAKKRRKRERKSRISWGVWQKIFELYNDDWSPEQISGALKLQNVCVRHETIYRRIYAEIRAGRLDRNICVGIAKSDGGGWLNESLDRNPSECQFQRGIRALGRRYR